MIVTQLFFDTDIFLKFVNDCRQIGITCPIVPGIMPINNYNSFIGMTGLCKTKVSKKMLYRSSSMKSHVIVKDLLYVFFLLVYFVSQCNGL